MIADLSIITLSYYVILIILPLFFSSFFFFNDTATTEIYTLSLHDALPIYFVKLTGKRQSRRQRLIEHDPDAVPITRARKRKDRKSTRLNSSHVRISYAVFCLKKKKKYFSAPSTFTSSTIIITLHHLTACVT